MHHHRSVEDTQERRRAHLDEAFTIFDTDAATQEYINYLLAVFCAPTDDTTPAIAVLDAAVGLLGLECGYLYTAHTTDGAALSVTDRLDVEDRWLAPATVRSDDGGIFLRALEGAVADDRAPGCSRLVAPLLVQNEMEGVLCVATAGDRAFTDRDRRSLSALARVSALAIRNRRLTTADGLTGLGNVRTFTSTLATEIARASRHERPLSVLAIDVDDFKHINDCYLHHVGDMVLRDLGALFRAAVRESDTPCRLHGDEFAIILPETSADDAGAWPARAVVERLQERIAAHRFPHGEPVAISVGIAGYDGRPHTTPDQLLHAADQAMYEDKRRRRAR